MDRFKFRAWSKELKKMFEKASINTKGECDFACTDKGKYAGTNYSEDCILMQSIGLKDKNGKLIFEGDICRLWANPKHYNGYKGHDYTGQVIFDKFYLSFVLSTGHDLRDFGNIEVIGNIYENPKLLSN